MSEGEKERDWEAIEEAFRREHDLSEFMGYDGDPGGLVAYLVERGFGGKSIDQWEAEGKALLRGQRERTIARIDRKLANRGAWVHTDYFAVPRDPGLPSAMMGEVRTTTRPMTEEERTEEEARLRSIRERLATQGITVEANP